MFNKKKVQRILCILIGLTLIFYFIPNVIQQTAISNLENNHNEYLYSSAPSHSFLINCNAVINSDEMEFKKAETLEKILPFQVPSDSQIYELTKNCAHYFKIRKYFQKPLFDEANFPIAYSIMVQDTAFEVERLLRAIYWPQNFYCIHIDKKAPLMFHKAIEGLANCFSNVFIASKLEVIVYPSISIIQADLNCMKDLLKLSPEWKYLINLAGQDFPLKTNTELVRILRIFNGQNDIENFESNVVSHRTQFSYKIKYDNNKNGQLVSTKIKKGLPPFSLKKGSRYGTFSRKFVEFIIFSNESINLFNWLNDTINPDESYWGTLNSNPNLNVPGGWSGDRRFFLSKLAIWKSNDHPHCQSNYFVRSVCIFGIRDLPFLSISPHFFANKFYSTYQPVAVTCLEELLYNRSMELSPSRLILDIYKNMSSPQLYNEKILKPWFPIF